MYNVPDPQTCPAHCRFNQLVEIMRLLRTPGGCPWDLEQTHHSITKHLIEEAYEVVDTIETNKLDHLAEELGDLLEQVVLHAQIAADEGRFTIDDVCAAIADKMIRRHPHVFYESAESLKAFVQAEEKRAQERGVPSSKLTISSQDLEVENAFEVLDLWDQIKLMERALKAQETESLHDAPASASAAQSNQFAQSVQTDQPLSTQAPDGVQPANQAQLLSIQFSDGAQVVQQTQNPGLLDDVPQSLPALMQAQKISRKAVSIGFEWETVDDVWDQVKEEIQEFLEAPHGSREREIEFGDILFSLVNVARKEGFDAEAALKASNAKFTRRFMEMEAQVRADARELHECSLEELEELWQQTKSKAGMEG